MSKNKRFWLGFLFCIFCPLLLVVYLIQVARYKPPPPSPEVPQEVQQYLLDGDLGQLKQRMTESLKQRQGLASQEQRSHREPGA